MTDDEIERLRAENAKLRAELAALRRQVATGQYVYVPLGPQCTCMTESGREKCPVHEGA